ncbi:hypothetical protein H072_9649 [Dactylellina haptotyla CBS 200.50]|uniref:Large ribosomal subunit protein mL45 n=1 Tax=Dactylellina haptotyla (strain CBS 200.50) TaxID=1284197 RepID=S8BC84_DACHA|nr:hypothetical protein H072_9649 [Dactylellina haptotyla CBS 200.50]
MASHKPLQIASRILSQRPTTGALQPFTRSQCPFLLPAQTRSLNDQKRMERSYKSQISRSMEGSAEPSMRVSQTAAMMNEIGEMLLPNTFVTPPMSRRPSAFSDTRNRIQFEWVRTKIRVQDLVSRILSRVWHSDQFFRKDLIPSAEALHRNMYTAYARGDIETLSQICGRDLYHTFRNRILSRPQNVQFSWKFSEYNSKSKIMSHKVGMLGVGKGDENNVRQAVVRIDSTQTLTKGVNGKVVKGTGEPTRTTEYIVLSKRKKKDEPETPWVVWGTVEESDMEDVRAFGIVPNSGEDTTVGHNRWG